jgi:F0F1-type ATP synthase delta subunit
MSIQECALAGIPRAQVRLAIAPQPAEVEALRQALETRFHTPLQLEVEVDAALLGGVWVRVGDTLLDGSLRTRLETLRQHLRNQCRTMILSAASMAELEKRNDEQQHYTP